MDIFTVIGVILAGIALILGSILKGSAPVALLNTGAAVVVFGGTIGAICVQTRGDLIKRAFQMFAWLFFPPSFDHAGLIRKIVDWSDIARRQGLLSLESSVETEHDVFARKGLQLLVDGGEPDAIRRTLEVELDAKEEFDKKAAAVYESAGIYSPTLGIVGAVLGLMSVMQHMSDPSSLGEGIAAAFVSTIYGIALANLFLLPMANKLKNAVQAESELREITIEGIISIAQGDNPRNIESKLQGYLQ